MKYILEIRERICQIWKNFNDDQGFLWATSLTYTTLFALVPLLAVGLSLFKAFGGFDDIQTNIILPFVSEMLDPTHKIKVMQHIQSYVDKIDAGALGVIGTSIFILTFVPLFLGMEKAINNIWGRVDDRPLWHKFITYWAITTLGPVAMVIIISLVSLFNEVIPGLQLLESLKPMMVFYLIFGLFLVYKLVPNTQVNNKSALTGAASGAAIWVLANIAYHTYMKHATASFNIYGSLGAIPVFLLWIYINWLIILLGAEISMYVQYPVAGSKKGGIDPAERFRASTDLLILIFQGMSSGQYLSEAQITSEMNYPPGVIPSVIGRLKSAGLLRAEGSIILPSKAANAISMSEIARIFMGNIEQDLFNRLSIDAQGLTDLSLEDIIPG
ncbi:MAG: YhjD/YihY/BrkB family envelope integrity protein [Thermodesulfobacteriota bacterium]|nr:YhjD/YihY/BrkB family envelope integrity protein [Thermodesulfobacteriota bacterium]